MSAYIDWGDEDVETTAGDDILWNFQVYDEDGVVVDITGWTFGFWAYDICDSTQTIVVANADFTIVTAASGIGRMAIPRATTLLLGGKVYKGCFWRTNSNVQKDLGSGLWEIATSARPAV